MQDIPHIDIAGVAHARIRELQCGIELLDIQSGLEKPQFVGLFVVAIDSYIPVIAFNDFRLTCQLPRHRLTETRPPVRPPSRKLLQLSTVAVHEQQPEHLVCGRLFPIAAKRIARNMNVQAVFFVAAVNEATPLQTPQHLWKRKPARPRQCHWVRDYLNPVNRHISLEVQVISSRIHIGHHVRDAVLIATYLQFNTH
ncbi:hypothetical protein [Mycobacteroides abscessus]|uniref:hypothetical protein n=1 Tax=Mycobacteroides abscessus TaxID=36809 RepID=UPI0010424212|nr:hypothetical protein [Mycobacteroides abscessus]